MKNEEQNVVNAVRRRFECQKKMSSGSQQNMNQILKYGYLTDKFSSACALAKKWRLLKFCFVMSSMQINIENLTTSPIKYWLEINLLVEQFMGWPSSYFANIHSLTYTFGISHCKRFLEIPLKLYDSFGDKLWPWPLPFHVIGILCCGQQHSGSFFLLLSLCFSLRVYVLAWHTNRIILLYHIEPDVCVYLRWSNGGVGSCIWKTLQYILLSNGNYCIASIS